MLDIIYERARKRFEAMSSQDQAAAEADLESQGFVSDEDKTAEFVKKFTNPELFQAAMSKARPSKAQELGGAVSSALGGLGESLRGGSFAAGAGQVNDMYRGLADQPAKNLTDDKESVMDYLTRQASTKKAANIESRAAAGEKRKVTEFDRTEEDEARKSDPASQLSVATRALAKEVGMENVPETTSARDLDGVIDQYAKISGRKHELRLAEIRNERADRKEAATAQSRADSKAHKETVRQDKLDKEARASTQKLGKELQSPQGVMSMYERIEDSMGMTMEEYDAKGQKPDLPGVNIPGYGRVGFYSDEAQELQGSIAALANKLLKEYSGAAVTTPEFQRFKEGMEQGRFNTEEGMLRALLGLKGTIMKDMGGIKAGYEGDVVSTYEGRKGGGKTSTPNEVVRNVNGKPAVFNPDTKQFIRWAE